MRHGFFGGAFFRQLLRAALFTLTWVVVPSGYSPPVQAQTKPLILPVALPPGASTWLLGQPYGNTIGAFLRGSEWYEAGQRLHFGIDLSMPCGTPLVAVADGEVVAVDDLSFGSGPHNLLIRHTNVGVVSLYGHLLERPPLVAGTFVTQGQEVALSGDPDITCDSRPHLHLEIRSLDYFSTYNPVEFIQADWHMLSLIGSFRYPVFQQNLDNAREWMSIDDQPNVQFGGRPLNDYAAPFPDLREGSPPPNPSMMRENIPSVSESLYSTRRLTFSGCCSGAWWHPTQPYRLFAIDGAPNQRAAIFEWNTREDSLSSLVGQAPPPYTSPDGTHEITLEGTVARIRRTADGAEWTVNTAGGFPSLSADNSALVWQIEGSVSTLNQPPRTEVWVSAADGTNPRMIAAENGLSAQWLDASRLLLSRREGIATTLGVYDTLNGDVIILGAWNRMRGLTVSPGGSRLMFYLFAQDDAAQSGVYSIETQMDAQAVQLSWFGAWRWRDANSVYYVPFDGARVMDAAADRNTLHIYDLVTGDDRLVLEDIAIANGEWSVSADGQQVVYWNADDLALWIAQPEL